MAVAVRWDTLREALVEEEAGALVRVVRGVQVTGLDEVAYNKHFQALEDAGLPIKNQSLDASYPHLRLVKRSVRSLPSSPSKAEVLLEYALLGVTEDNNFTFHYETSISQQTTQVDKWGRQILVAHAYPANDQYIIDQFGTNVVEVGVDVPVLVPEVTCWARGVIPVDYPVVVIAKYQNTVNSTYWNGGMPGTWMCVAVTSDPHNLQVSPREYKFTVRWQYRRAGWQPIAWMRDPRTGAPPKGVVWGVGVVPFPYYEAVDYRQQFPDY